MCACGKRMTGAGVAALCGILLAGCQTAPPAIKTEMTVRDAVERYSAAQSDRLSRTQATPPAMFGARDWNTLAADAEPICAASSDGTTDAVTAIYLLGTFTDQKPVLTTGPAGPATTTQLAGAPRAMPPEGYWRQDVWHQMGHEALDMGRHDFWNGFKSSYWNLENALVLTATMGASVTFRETGVDDTIAGRIKGHRQLGDMDEPIQLLGNPATHFAAAGVLWLGSALTKDMKEHEFSKALIDALAVNGVSTLLLKTATNTSAPNGDRHAWPSGHTSSAFTVAAVVNEYYGPWAGIPALGLAGLVGYQRLDSRVHDFSDVVFGGMMGYIIGTSIARDQKAEFPELFGMKVVPYVDPESGSSGLALWKQF